MANTFLHPGPCIGQGCRDCFRVAHGRFPREWGITEESRCAWLNETPWAAAWLASIQQPHGIGFVQTKPCCPDKTLPEGLTLDLPAFPPCPVPLSVTRYDASNLAPELGAGERFNASFLRWHGRDLLAWRFKRVGSRIVLTDLGTGQSWPLDLQHRFAEKGREDPRLFTFGDNLYVAFTAVSMQGNISMAYASLVDKDGGYVASRVLLPDWDKRQRHEKNWGAFSHDGNLYCVYSIAPTHRILRIDGSNAAMAYETEWKPMFESGEPRGGASPILVGNEFYSWCHTIRHADKMYCTSLYTFDAFPPFKPRRCAKWPLVVPTNQDVPAGGKRNVWYVCGAFLDNDELVLSGGVYDAFTEIRRYKRADIEDQLEIVS